MGEQERSDGGHGHIGARKARLRAQGRAARRVIGAGARAAAAAAVAGHLDALLPADGLVMGYAATAEELPLDVWSARRLRRGGRLALPRVRGSALEVVEVADLTRDLAPGWRGLAEPTGEPCRLGELVALVLPGTAFDRRGQRLGQGGGHVDRLLAALPAGVLTIGICYAVQLVDDVPREAHDRPVDVVLTERGSAADVR